MRIARLATVLLLASPLVARAGMGASAFPVVYSTPETGFAGGAGAILTYRMTGGDPSDRPQSLAFGAIYTAKGQAIALIAPELYLDRQAWRLQAILDYQKFPTSIYGIGNATPADSKEDYTLEGGSVQGSLLRRIHRGLRAGLAGDLKQRSIQAPTAGGLIDRRLLDGSDGGLYFGIGPALEWDDRDSPFRPTRGSWAQARFTAYRRWLGSDAGFESFGIDLRHYAPLGHSHVLGGQILVSARSGDVPFHDLARLGDVMRGMIAGRLTDRAVVFAQAEDRFPIRGRFGGVTFASLGDVSGGLERFQVRDLKCGAGLGLRFLLNKQEGMNLRADFGVTRFGGQVYFQILEAF
jgi:outer membrane protein assembly factor BamA